MRIARKLLGASALAACWMVISPSGVIAQTQPDPEALERNRPAPGTTYEPELDALPEFRLAQPSLAPELEDAASSR